MPTLEEKPTHLLDENDHGSPPAAKKRRTDAGPDDEISIDAQFPGSDQHGPGHKIEEELANALAEGNANDLPSINGTHENLGSDPSATAAVAQEGTSNSTPDVNSMITDILDHTERQEETVAMGPQEIPPSGDFPGAKGYAFLNLKANSHLKIQSLPILDNLVGAPDIVSILASSYLVIFLVDPNPLVPVKEQLPRPHCDGVRARFRERPGVCDYALLVRSHETSLHDQALFPPVNGPRDY